MKERFPITERSHLCIGREREGRKKGREGKRGREGKKGGRERGKERGEGRKEGDGWREGRREFLIGVIFTG